MYNKLKNLASLLMIVFLAGCAGKPTTSPSEVSYASFEVHDDANRSNLTISNYEIIAAKLQNIPLLDLGTDYKNALKILKKHRLTVTKTSDHSIEVKGYKNQKLGKLSVTLAEVNYFIYKFEHGKLISGPNIISK